MDSYHKRFMKPSRKHHLDKNTQLLFLSRLLRFLKNGYTLLEALEVMKWDKQMVNTSEVIISELKSGKKLDEAFVEASFNPVITSYLYFVRINGDITTNIEKCIEMYRQRIEFTTKFQQTVRYPLILLAIFTILLYFIKHLILPSFETLFASTATTSSTVTVSLLTINIFSTLIWISVFITILLLVLWKIVRSRFPIKTQLKIYQKIPIYRSYKRIQTSFLFATHFSSLLKTGISIKDILSILSNQTQLPILAFYSKQMTNELNSGRHISYLLSQTYLMEKQLATIFQKNADIYALEKDLKVYAVIITEEINQKITKVITYIQPVFFGLLAIFIILVYTTLMWPMFQLIKTI